MKETRDHLDAAGFLGTARKEEISGYRGGYTPLERKSIEQRMISGDLLGLVSTNALELGIDIGKISTTVLGRLSGNKSIFLAADRPCRTRKWKMHQLSDSCQPSHGSVYRSGTGMAF